MTQAWRFRTLARPALVTVLTVALGATLLAQRGGYFGSGSYSANQRYDGRFVFVRISYSDFSGRGGPRWAHDFPQGEEHFMKILDALTVVNGHVEEHNIMSLSDPEIFKFPLIYMAEPGHWSMSDADGVALRAYLLKGGFMILDDFRDSNFRRTWDWANLEANMARAIPELKWIEVSPQHPIFHSFYDIANPHGIPQYYDTDNVPHFMALFQDNDPNKRMLVMANHNTDLSEYWEFSDTGRKPVDETNEAYKVGVNEFMYGIIH